MGKSGWIKKSVSLISDLKTIRAARLLGWSRYEVAGLVSEIWSLADLQFPGGIFHESSWPDILSAIDCKKDEKQVLIALLDCGGVEDGFLEREGELLSIHGWREWQSGEEERRNAQAERTRRSRAKAQKQEASEPCNVTVTPCNVTVTLPQCDVTLPQCDVTNCNALDRQTDRQDKSYPHFANAVDSETAVTAACGTGVCGDDAVNAVAVADAVNRGCGGDAVNAVADAVNRGCGGDAVNAVATASEVYITKKGRRLTGKQLRGFLKFWKVFNLKKDKASAADSWLDLKIDNPLFRIIMVGAKAEAEARAALIKKGGSPKWAQGWLSARRWEDESPPPQAEAVDEYEQWNAAHPDTEPSPEILAAMDALAAELNSQNGESNEQR